MEQTDKDNIKIILIWLWVFILCMTPMLLIIGGEIINK